MDGLNFVVGATSTYEQSRDRCDVRGCPNGPAVRVTVRVPDPGRPLGAKYDAIAYVIVGKLGVLPPRPLAVCLEHAAKASADFGTQQYFEAVVGSLRAGGYSPGAWSTCRVQLEPLPTSN